MDHAGHDRRPTIPAHEVSGVVEALGYGTFGVAVGQAVYGLADWYRDGAAAVITEGTAGVHVSHILNKLGFHSRAEVASWARRQGLSPKSDPHHGPRGLGGIQA